jgi:hypothetical protein
MTRSVILPALVANRQPQNLQNRFWTSLLQPNLKTQKSQHYQIWKTVAKVLMIPLPFFETQQRIRHGTMFFNQHLQIPTLY